MGQMSEQGAQARRKVARSTPQSISSYETLPNRLSVPVPGETMFRSATQSSYCSEHRSIAIRTLQYVYVLYTGDCKKGLMK